LWTWISNPSAIIHPPVTILNAGRAEDPADFLFYVEGLTPSVKRVVDALDAERMAMGAALGLELIGNDDTAKMWCGHQGYQGSSYPDKERSPVYASI
jgi:hypothetical protein